MRLARHLHGNVKAHILIVGQGDEYELINDLAVQWKLDNVTILPSVSQSEFLNYLGVADVGLFSLAKEHTSHNFLARYLGIGMLLCQFWEVLILGMIYCR